MLIVLLDFYICYKHMFSIVDLAAVQRREEMKGSVCQDAHWRFPA